MGAKYEKLMASMQAELEGKQPEETKPTETAAPETPAETPTDPEQPTEPAQPEENPKADEPKEPETPTEPEGKPEETPKPDKTKRDIPEDPVKRAEHAFKNQLQKQKQKHEAELKERDEKYEKLLKEIEDLKKSKADAPKKELRREDFKDDEDFVRALQADEIQKALAARDEEAANKAAEQAEAERKRKEAEDELRESQQQWLNNVGEAFEGDRERANAFLTKIQYANKNGLGEILDNCPVASDYLMHDPMGPVVFEKILNDRDTFNRVFDMRRLTPMNIFYQLKRVEEELNAPAPAAATPEAAPAKPAMPHLGKPGRQAAGSSMTNNDMFSDNKAVKKWLREHR